MSLRIFCGCDERWVDTLSVGLIMFSTGKEVVLRNAVAHYRSGVSMPSTLHMSKHTV